MKEISAEFWNIVDANKPWGDSLVVEAACDERLRSAAAYALGLMECKKDFQRDCGDPYAFIADEVAAAYGLSDAQLDAAINASEYLVLQDAVQSL